MEPTEFLYEHGDGVEAREFVELPRWLRHLDSEIDGSTIAAIIEGGVESGAFMPAATYSSALNTMGEYGDDVFSDLEELYGEIPNPPERYADSWSGMAIFYLSAAVEAWANSIAEELVDEMEAEMESKKEQSEYFES